MQAIPGAATLTASIAPGAGKEGSLPCSPLSSALCAQAWACCPNCGCLAAHLIVISHAPHAGSVILPLPPLTWQHPHGH